MAKKKKSKLKKVLRNLGVGAAILGAGKALMSRRDKANQMKEFLATEGGDISILPKKKRFINIDGRMAAPIDFDANPREIADMVKSYGAGNPKRSRFDFAMKKGGRVKKGFAKKKKQANKMRKK